MKSKHILQIVLLSAAWGVSFLMMRIAVVTFPPLWIAMLRCALGASLLCVVLFIGGQRMPPRRLWPWLLTIAFFNNVVPFTFFAWGELTVPSNIAAVLNATVPIWTLLLAMTLQRSAVGLRTIVGVVLSFAGVLLVVLTHRGETASGGKSEGMMFGLIIIVIATMSYAIATHLAKVKLQGLDPIGLATTQLCLSTAMLLPLALAGEWPSPLHLAPVAAIAVLGFAGSGIAYLLYYSLLAHVSATQVVAVTYLLPVWGLFWGLFAHEAIGWIACAGVAITIAGLIVLNRRPKTQTAAAAGTRTASSS